MRDDIERAAWAAAEPCFDAPPRLVLGPERRLTGYAEAAFRGGGGGHAFRDNALRLARGAAGAVTVTASGAAVTAAFGVAAGPLDGPAGSLGAVLGEAFAAAAASGAVTPFEAAVSTAGMECVLLRGVLMPTAAGADVVLSWKQVLDDDAAARLRAELLREFRPRDRRSSLVNVFA